MEHHLRCLDPSATRNRRGIAEPRAREAFRRRFLQSTVRGEGIGNGNSPPRERIPFRDEHDLMSGKPESRIKVLLVDDHPLVLEGVRSSFLRRHRFQIVGEAFGGQEAIKLARQCSPDVVVMDIAMPGMDGLEATRVLLKACPQAKVLILTVHEKPEFVREIIQSGARGYVRKSSPPAELIAAVESVHDGELFFKPDVAEAFFHEYVLNEGKMEEASPKRLSKREHEVLKLIVEGMANRQIAARFRLSVRTVEKHRQSVMKKLGIHKATELVKFAITRGFVNLL